VIEVRKSAILSVQEMQQQVQLNKYRRMTVVYKTILVV
jgi:hypothetical protein